ncbi:MAG: DUF4116 domain-containing protein [Ruminococcaceae bacterium]|nr:DUF4116 domain-containing protein [Oscillospiraceae bacterium]
MRLEQELNLVEVSPVEMAYREPTGHRLKQVPKAQQTYELVKFVVSNDGNALKYASKKLITEELCRIAVQENGLALRYVPNSLMTSELCDLAISRNGLAFEYVPEKMRTSALAKKAVRYDCGILNYEKYPIAYVPTKKISASLLVESVKYSPHSLRDIPQKNMNQELVLEAVLKDGTALCYAPKRIVNKKIIDAALANNPFAIEFITKNRIKRDMCLECLEREPLTIRYIPYEFLDAEICETVFARNFLAFKYIPEEFKTIDMCLKVISEECFQVSYRVFKAEDKVFFDDIPHNMRNEKRIIDAIVSKFDNGASLLLEWNEKNREENVADSKDEKNEPLDKEIEVYIKAKYEEEIARRQERQNLSPVGRKMYELSNLDNEKLLVPLETKSVETLPACLENVKIFHDLASGENSAKTFYYVTDIHLEHQLKNVVECAIKENKILVPEVIEFLDSKIQEMISTAKDNESTLLVGGDVAGCKELTILFYRLLKAHWKGNVVFILGNHELWDGKAGAVTTDGVRSVDEIVNEYRERVNDRERHISEWLTQTYMLENDVYIVYKNKSFNGERVIRENQILDASIEELSELFEKASTIILGGVGFSGLNPQYNAEMGLYRSTVASLEADRELSKRFYKIYDKMKQCAGNKQVIVLTHTPVFDWTNEPCNPNWIYVNGHTHHNQMEIEENGAAILSDNQIGYKPRKWKLNAFSSFGWYDPFENYQDGIYKINSEQYKDFNIGRGISSKGCNYQGQIYMLKRDGLYMFLLDSMRSLCLLSGGQRKTLEEFNVKYYYDNMARYGQAVRDAIKPYQQFVEAISKEVKSFGGSGKIHGCIVDVSWFSHIYINPFDGKVTPYWALDICSRVVYDNLQLLLEAREPTLAENFMLEYNKQALPIIGTHIMNNSKQKGTEIATVPRWVLGTEMYAPSRIMKSVQYIWSQNVIRVWNEDVLRPKERNKLEKKG